MIHAEFAQERKVTVNFIYSNTQCANRWLFLKNTICGSAVYAAGFCNGFGGELDWNLNFIRI